MGIINLVCAKPTSGVEPVAEGSLIGLRRDRTAGGLLLELMISLSLIGLVVTASIVGLLSTNRQAAIHRAMTSARVIVERNIEAATNAPFTTSLTPAILQTTSGSGAIWDDDGGGDNLVNILVQNNDGTGQLLKGTLRRIVTAEPNPENATIRRVTFRLTFELRSRNYTTEMTTLRAIDDF